MDEKDIQIKNIEKESNFIPPRPMPPRPNVPPKPNPPPRPSVSTAEQKSAKSPEAVEESVAVDESVKVEEPVVAQPNKKSTTNQKNKSKSEKNRTSKRAKDKFPLKKTLIFGAIGLGSLGAIAGLVFLVLFLIPGKVLTTPANLKVCEVEDSAYVVCEPVDEAIKYIFVIGDKTYESATPILDLGLLTTPDTYQIKVKAIGEKRKSESAYSSTVSYILQERLEAPIIYFQNSESSVVAWAGVERATSYALVVNGENRNIGNVLSYDLKLLGGGEYIVSLRACSVEGYLNDSFKSNELSFSYVEKLSGVGGRIVEEKKIEIDRVANAKSYNITINANTYVVAKFAEAKYVFDPSVFIDLSHTDITYVKIEAVGEGYFQSSWIELSL